MQFSAVANVSSLCIFFAPFLILKSTFDIIEYFSLKVKSSGLFKFQFDGKFNYLFSVLKTSLSDNKYINLLSSDIVKSLILIKERKLKYFSVSPSFLII